MHRFQRRAFSGFSHALAAKKYESIARYVRLHRAHREAQIARQNGELEAVRNAFRNRLVSEFSGLAEAYVTDDFIDASIPQLSLRLPATDRPEDPLVLVIEFIPFESLSTVPPLPACSGGLIIDLVPRDPAAAIDDLPISVHGSPAAVAAPVPSRNDHLRTGANPRSCLSRLQLSSAEIRLRAGLEKDNHQRNRGVDV